MPYKTLALLFLPLCGGATAQQFIDPFSYAPSTNIPGYTEQTGDWRALGSEVQCQLGVSRQVLVKDNIVDFDGCVEAIAVYDTANPGLQHAGVVFRYSGAGRTGKFYHVTLSDIRAPYTGWTHYSVRYESQAQEIVGGFLGKGTTRARIRLQVSEHPSGVRVATQIDTNMDGIWDVNESRVTFWGLGSGTGGIGLFAGSGSKFDEFRWYNATLYVDGIPKIGTSLPLMGRGSPLLPYVAALSLGHQGFALDATRRMPIDPDPLFLLSLSTPMIFQNFIGTTDAAGNFTMMFHIPPVSQLIGLSVWCSAVTFKGGAVAEITPDVQITFGP